MPISQHSANKRALATLPSERHAHWLPATIAAHGTSLLTLLSLLIFSVATAAVELDWNEGSIYKPGHFAITVGIDEYSDASLPDLDHAVDDAMRLSSVLRTQGYAVTTLTNFQTDPNDLLAWIVRVGEEMDRTVGRENGTLVLTYAGHGFEQDRQNYLAMGRANPDNLGATSLSMTRLKNVLAESGIGRKILLIDACRSKPGRAANDNERVFLKQSYQASGLSVIFSSSPGEPSHEYGSIEQGVFSYFAALGLAGKAIDDAGWVTVSSLFDWVSQQIAGFTVENGYPPQQPWRESENDGDMRITRPLLLGASRSGAGTVAPPVVARVDNDEKETSFWKIAATVAGVIVVGIALSAASHRDDGASEPAITILIPTP